MIALVPKTTKWCTFTMCLTRGMAGLEIEHHLPKIALNIVSQKIGGIDKLDNVV